MLIFILFLEHVEDVLLEINNILGENEVLFEDKFSYADICIFSLIETSFPTRGEITYGAISKQSQIEVNKNNWEELYSNVFETKEIIMQNYLNDDTINDCKIILKHPLIKEIETLE